MSVERLILRASLLLWATALLPAFAQTEATKNASDQEQKPADENRPAKEVEQDILVVIREEVYLVISPAYVGKGEQAVLMIQQKYDVDRTGPVLLKDHASEGRLKIEHLIERNEKFYRGQRVALVFRTDIYQLTMLDDAGYKFTREDFTNLPDDADLSELMLVRVPNRDRDPSLERQPQDERQPIQRRESRSYLHRRGPR